MDRADQVATLGFTARRPELGIVDGDRIAAPVLGFEAGDDPHPEHARRVAFRAFLAESRPLTPTLAVVLYELGERDPDEAAGLAMMSAGRTWGRPRASISGRDDPGATP